MDEDRTFKDEFGNAIKNNSRVRLYYPEGTHPSLHGKEGIVEEVDNISLVWVRETRERECIPIGNLHLLES